ncbi:MAG: ACP S-malonyltransferase [Gemmatimonadaceae bacterium]
MSTAFLFPGQGTDIADAVDDWRRLSHVARLLDGAADALGVSPDQLTRRTHITRTSIVQPVLTALTLGIHHCLGDEGVAPECVAGHSVGELAACAAAGAITDEDVIALAVIRGALMEREAARHGGRMISLRGSSADVDAALTAAAKHGSVSLAAHNAADEWVVSGDVAALRAVAALLPSTALDTDGPWHSLAMRAAVDPYRDALRHAVSGSLSLPFVSNRIGVATRDSTLIPELLASQLIHPVQWVRSMETLSDRGITQIIICGPGKSLRRFAAAMIPAASVSIVSHPDHLSRDFAAMTVR